MNEAEVPSEPRAHAETAHAEYGLVEAAHAEAPDAEAPDAEAPDAGRALSSVSSAKVTGSVVVSGETLRAPASGTPCAHWRLRVFETVAPGMELVHEMSASAPLEIACEEVEGGGTRVVRVPLDEARIEAFPIVHRPGSEGALAVAKQFGLIGAVRVEEVIVRPGERVRAVGTLLDPDALCVGPFRHASCGAQLLAATVYLGGGLSLRPALLPWALGTAAALLGTSAVVATIAKLVRGPGWHGGIHAVSEIGARRIERPRWP